MFGKAARAIVILAVVSDEECRKLIAELARPPARGERGRVVRFATGATAEEALRTIPAPDLVLVELDDDVGPQVLHEIKSDARLHSVPVIGLTEDETAASNTDRCYDELVNCVVPLRGTTAERRAALHWLESFWFSLAQLPTSA